MGCFVRLDTVAKMESVGWQLKQTPSQSRARVCFSRMLACEKVKLSAIATSSAEKDDAASSNPTRVIGWSFPRSTSVRNVIAA